MEVTDKSDQSMYMTTLLINQATYNHAKGMVSHIGQAHNTLKE